jgi:DNA-binding transcriptional LysR family regulator
MLDLKQEMLNAAESPNTITGQVRIGVSETIVQTWLPQFLESVHARYPAVSVELEVETTPVLREQVLSHRINLAFLLGPLLSPQLENIPICKYPLAWIASPKLGLNNKKVTLEQVCEYPIITYSAASAPHHFVRSLITASGIHAPRMYGSASLSVVVRMTLDAIGVAVITPTFLKTELSEGRLCILNVTASELPELAFTASWAKGPDEHIARALAKLAEEISGQYH